MGQRHHSMAHANGGSVLLRKEEESGWVQQQENEEERRGVSLTVALRGRQWKAKHRAGEVLCVALKRKRLNAERKKSQRLRAAIAVLHRCTGACAAGSSDAEQRGVRHGRQAADKTHVWHADGKGVGEGLMGGPWHSTWWRFKMI
jgi:hypothetical protein